MGFVTLDQVKTPNSRDARRQLIGFVTNRKRRNMRMMLKIVIPTETGNQAIKDGSLHKILESAMSKLKPEAAYFLPEAWSA